MKETLSGFNPKIEFQQRKGAKYFSITIGVLAVNKETVKHYIEDCQDRHWQRIEKPKFVNLQKKIGNAYFSKSSSSNLRKACDFTINLDKILDKIIDEK